MSSTSRRSQTLRTGATAAGVRAVAQFSVTTRARHYEEISP
ncbi:MAG: hypothetical protein ACLP4R_17325 [Solirubrobacteraceae bacterium]